MLFPSPPPPRSDFFCGPCDLIHGRPRDGLLLFRSIVSKKQVGSNSRRHSLSDDSRDAFSIMLFGASSIHRHHNHHNNGNTGSFGFCFYCISFQGWRWWRLVLLNSNRHRSVPFLSVVVVVVVVVAAAAVVVVFPSANLIDSRDVPGCSAPHAGILCEVTRQLVICRTGSCSCFQQRQKNNAGRSRSPLPKYQHAAVYLFIYFNSWHK